jgi:hypothetical protein
MRTREFEIRRVLRQIARAEDRERVARFELEGDLCPVDPEGTELARKWWAGEVERLEGRLLGLLT